MVKYKHTIDDKDRPGIFCRYCDDAENITVDKYRAGSLDIHCANCNVFWEWNLKTLTWEEFGRDE